MFRSYDYLQAEIYWLGLLDYCVHTVAPERAKAPPAAETHHTTTKKQQNTTRKEIVEKCNTTKTAIRPA
jgi:hypothetical protein